MRVKIEHKAGEVEDEERKRSAGGRERSDKREKCPCRCRYTGYTTKSFSI